MEGMLKDKILLAHGSGGKLAHELVEKVFAKALDNPLLAKLDDSAVVDFSGRLAFTTDSYVVSPIFFPGADIGKLAVCGTVNDLAMSGAKPLYLSKTDFVRFAKRHFAVAAVNWWMKRMRFVPIAKRRFSLPVRHANLS